MTLFKKGIYLSMLRAFITLSVLSALCFSTALFADEAKMTIEEFAENWELVNINDVIADKDMQALGMQGGIKVEVSAIISASGQLESFRIISEQPSDMGYGEIVINSMKKNRYQSKNNNAELGRVVFKYLFGL